MNTVKDAFAILYFLASADGQVDERETQIIVDFINRQQGQLNFDSRQTVTELAALTDEARIETYDRALFGFRDNSSMQDRYTLMHFAADLAAADGAISENEKILFQDMAKVWGVDTQALFQQSRNFVQSTAAPPVAPTLTVTTTGINYVNTPAAPATVAAAPAEASSQKTNRAIYFAWSLGSSLASDSIAMTHINAAQTEPHFERAQMSAMGLGITVNRLTGMTHDQISNDAKASLHLLADEGRRIAEQIDALHGGTISSYFKMIVRCHLLLLFYNDRLEHRKSNQSLLDNVLSLKPDTIIPDAFFQPLISAVRENVAWFVFKPIVYEFDRAVGEFLHERIDGEKNTVEKMPAEENHQTPDFKSTAQTTQTAAQPSPNPPVTLSEPLQTLAAYSQGRAGNDRVLRALVDHQGWYVPLQLFLKTAEDKSRQKKVVFISAEDRVKESEIRLFTDYASLMRAAAANAPIGSYAGAINGTELFGLIPTGIKSIRINPYSPVEQTWSFLDETSVEMVRLWSEVIALEEKLKYFQPGKPDLAALSSYHGFITIVNAETNSIFLIKEFNEEMRIAAPVFTAPDSADRFLASLPPEKSRALKQITINGDTLLNDLPNMKIEMPNEQPSRSFDGAVINAYGPGVFHILRFDDIRK